MNDLTRFNHSQSQWRLQPHMKEPGCREWNLYKSIVARRLPPSRPLNPWQSSHRPCAESMSGLGCNRKEKEKKERQGWGRRKEAVNKKNKKKKVGAGVGGGDDGVRGRFMGDVYYYTALPQGGEGRGVGRERQNIPFPLPLLWLHRSHAGGRRALSLPWRRQEMLVLYWNVEYSLR